VTTRVAAIPTFPCNRVLSSPLVHNFQPHAQRIEDSSSFQSTWGRLAQVRINTELATPPRKQPGFDNDNVGKGGGGRGQSASSFGVGGNVSWMLGSMMKVLANHKMRTDLALWVSE
jgi:hypothetical protein